MEEQFDVINEQDEVIGQAARSVVHAQGLWHRGVHVFLFNSDGKILIQKRSTNRKQYASLWDCSVSEHVKAGEEYRDAAARGLEEELGISGLDLEPVATFRMAYGPGDNEISTLFHAVANLDDVHFDPEELQAVEYIGMDELLARMKNEPASFCGWFVETLHWYQGLPFNMHILREHTRERLVPSAGKR